ncbi:hypothetical protein BU16DRAFT_623534 [Lophium mytilinum]|uniref:CENP-V/GFA domain-containing protein n=1 Tax=Lophium mytilinum TaxID=390894 RepID=A0A6A6Q8U7_9PEZI|nr:hypothetical protein BU16DRAFT_623534 [Lophium mytilinum]
MVSGEGGCFCGKIRYSVNGEGLATALCHCTDCRKITGSTYSTNLVIKEESFKWLSGTPKTISKTADSGKEIISHFCGDCGSTLSRTGGSFPDQVIVKVGTLDDFDALKDAKPVVEFFAPERVDWVNAVPGAGQNKTMT